MSTGRERRPAADPDRYVRAVRRCLKCNKEFDSAWAGERICRWCKSSSIYRDSALVVEGNAGGRVTLSRKRRS